LEEKEVKPEEKELKDNTKEISDLETIKNKIPIK
jgi:hypothetical protein